MTTMQMDGHDVLSREAGADLAGKLHYFVKFDSVGKVVLAGAGEAACGVLLEENHSTSSPYGACTFQHSGVSKVVSGAGINAGVEVQSDGNGKVVTLSSGVALGRAVGGPWSSGDLVEVKLY